jgi:hypothetical protein
LEATPDYIGQDELSAARKQSANGLLGSHWAVGRQTGSSPFPPSRGPLAAVLPLFPRCLQLPIPVGLNLLLMPGEHVLWRDVADGAVQTVVMLYVTLNQTPRIFERQRRSRADALRFE